MEAGAWAQVRVATAPSLSWDVLPLCCLNCFSAPSWSLQRREDLVSSPTVLWLESIPGVWLLLNLTVGQGGALRTDRIPFLVAGLTPQSGTLGCLLRFLLRKHGACRNMASCRGARHKHAVFSAPSPGSSFSGLPAQDLAWDPSSGIPPPCVCTTVP